MTRTCPACQNPVVLAEQGSTPCPACGHLVESPAVDNADQSALGADPPQASETAAEAVAPGAESAPPPPVGTGPLWGPQAAPPPFAPQMPAPEPPGARVAPVDLGQAPCSQHPGNPASTVCERCGDFMCRLCTTPVEGRSYCPKCFDLLYNRGALGFTQRQFSLPTITFALGLCGMLISFVCFCVNVVVSLPLSIAGIWLGMRTLKELNERPELPGRTLTLLGLGFSIAGVVISLAEIGFWIWTFTRK